MPFMNIHLISVYPFPCLTHPWHHHLIFVIESPAPRVIHSNKPAKQRMNLGSWLQTHHKGKGIYCQQEKSHIIRGLVGGKWHEPLAWYQGPHSAPPHGSSRALIFPPSWSTTSHLQASACAVSSPWFGLPSKCPPGSTCLVKLRYALRYVVMYNYSIFSSSRRPSLITSLH